MGHFRILVFALATISGILATYAQNIAFKKLSWWNPGYPTVVNAGSVTMFSDKVDNKYGFPSDREINETKLISGMEDFTLASNAWKVGLMWTLTEVDGRDVRNFTDDEWQSYCENPNVHDWAWLTPYGTHTTKGFVWEDLKHIKTPESEL